MHCREEAAGEAHMYNAVLIAARICKVLYCVNLCNNSHHSDVVLFAAGFGTFLGAVQ